MSGVRVPSPTLKPTPSRRPDLSAGPRPSAREARVATDAGNVSPLAATQVKPHRRARPLPYLGIVVALAAFAVLAAFVELTGKPCFAWDARLSEAVQAAPWPPGFQSFMRVVSWAGDNVFLAGVVVAGA